MPPQAVRSISSYFAKPPAKPVAAVVTTSTTTNTSPIPAAENEVQTTITQTTTSSSPGQPSPKEIGFPPDTARQAIREGGSEVQATKKIKLSDGSAKSSELQVTQDHLTSQSTDGTALCLSQKSQTSS